MNGFANCKLHDFKIQKFEKLPFVLLYKMNTSNAYCVFLSSLQDGRSRDATSLLRAQLRRSSVLVSARLRSSLFRFLSGKRESREGSGTEVTKN